MPTILIVDDEKDATNILTMILADKGFEILTAENGQQGLDIARQARPDVIITDVLMPVMDGYALYKALKNDVLTKNIPVVILTGRKAMEGAFDAVGVDCFIEKPVDPAQLIQTIQQLLERHHGGVPKKKCQKVLVAGTYPEVVRQIADDVEHLGHQALTVMTAAEVITQSVMFNPDVLILEVQTEDGRPAADVIRAVRILPNLKTAPILLYSYYHVSDLGNSDFRSRVLNIEKAKDACMAAGGMQYLDRYHRDLFQEWAAQYL